MLYLTMLAIIWTAMIKKVVFQDKTFKKVRKRTHKIYLKMKYTLNY